MGGRVGGLRNAVIVLFYKEACGRHFFIEIFVLKRKGIGSVYLFSANFRLSVVAEG